MVCLDVICDINMSLNYLLATVLFILLKYFKDVFHQINEMIILHTILQTFKNTVGQTDKQSR